jgi:hypothetical protein
VRVLQKHAAQMSARQFVPPLFAAALLLALCAAPFSKVGVAALLCLAAAYTAANLVASALEARMLPRRGVLLLPIVFATLHVAYGIGFLKGLVYFWNRWGDRATRAAPFEPLASPVPTHGQDRPSTIGGG